MKTLPFTISVPGVPAPQGSKRIGRARGGRPIILDANDSKLGAWRNTVTFLIGVQWRLSPASREPIAVELGFRLPQLKTPVRELPTAKPDLDKLVRAALDAITDAHVWHDDAQVVEIHTTKRYATPELEPGVTIRIREVAT